MTDGARQSNLGTRPTSLPAPYDMPDSTANQQLATRTAARVAGFEVDVSVLVPAKDEA